MAAGAEPAGDWPLGGGGVLAAVRDEVGALAEGLAAHLALVGLLPCKDPQIKTSTRQSMASTII